MGKHSEAHVYGTRSVNNHTFSEEVFPVEDYQFLSGEWVTLKIELLPAWGLKSQPMITSEVFYVLKVAQNLMRTMSEHRNVLHAHTAVKVDRLSGCGCGPSHKEAAQFVHPHTFSPFHLACPLRQDSSAELIGVGLVAACLSFLSPEEQQVMILASPDSALHLILQIAEIR